MYYLFQSPNLKTSCCHMNGNRNGVDLKVEVYMIKEALAQNVKVVTVEGLQGLQMIGDNYKGFA